MFKLVFLFSKMTQLLPRLSRFLNHSTLGDGCPRTQKKLKGSVDIISSVPPFGFPIDMVPFKPFCQAKIMESSHFISKN